MVVLTPLGLLAPGGAFGEDAPDDLTSDLGLSAIAAGMARYADFWQTRHLPRLPVRQPVDLHRLGRSSGSSSSGSSSTSLGRLVLRALGGRGRRSPSPERRRRHSAAEPAVTHRWRPPPACRPGCSQQDLAMCPCGCIGKRKKGCFVAKTLTGGAGLLQPDDVQRGRRRPARPAATRRSAGQAGQRCSSCSWSAASSARSPRSSPMYAPDAGPGGRVGAAGRVLRQAGVAVRSDLHRDRVLPATLSIVTPGDVVLPLWHWHGHRRASPSRASSAAA